MKRVLVLGAGFVSRPLVRYLLHKGYHVTVASLAQSNPQELIGGHKNGEAYILDVENQAELVGLIGKCDLAVSLVPYELHPLIAELCIDKGKHMVTASYVSPAMEALDGQAKAAGVTCLNEIGVDPGIDHMSAMRIIDGVKAKGGTIVSFKSYCGGLPAPDVNDNPFGYKFSWSPRGVLLASRSSAQYLRNGRKVEVAPERLFRDMHVRHVEGGGDFEAYPNRDAISYIDIYGLRGIETMYRGTLRNMGWCDTMHSFGRLGLLDLDKIDVQGKSYADLMRELLGAGASDDLEQVIGKKLGIASEALPVRNLQWLGMLSDRRIKGERIAPLDALGELMREKLAYSEGERDMVVLLHDFEVKVPGGERAQITSTMVNLGIEKGDSSMSRTVALPAAIATHLIVQGAIKRPGVIRPVTPDIYNPVLDELATLNIDCQEKVESY